MPYERVRTAGKALARLEELAVDAAGSAKLEVAVAHLANADRAATLAERLGDRLAPGLEGRPVHVGEIGAVLGAHVGPGMVAVTVPRDTLSSAASSLRPKPSGVCRYSTLPTIVASSRLPFAAARSCACAT